MSMNVKYVDYALLEFYDEPIEIIIGIDGRLWVNVNGVCALRAVNCKSLTVEDRRLVAEKQAWDGRDDTNADITFDKRGKA